MYIAQFAYGSLVGSHTIGDDCLGSAVALQGFLQKRQSSGLIPLFRDVALENFSFMIDRAPHVMLLPVYLHEHFVEVPMPVTNPADARNRLAGFLGRGMAHIYPVTRFRSSGAFALTMPGTEIISWQVNARYKKDGRHPR